MDMLSKPPERETEPAGATDQWRRRLRAFLAAARRHPVLGLALLAVVLGTLGYGVFRSEEDAQKPIIATVEKGNIENVVTALGSLQPLTFVDVGAQVSGQLKTIAVQVGDQVDKGDLVAEIDSTVASAKVDADKAQLQNLYAQLAERQSNLQLATAQADRQTRLKASNATSQDAYDSAQAAQRSAQAQVKALQAQITQSESQLKADQATLGYAKIYAPISGTISSIAAKQGQTLNANQSAPTILQVADLSVMTVSTQVSEADVPKLRVGMPAYFTTLGNPNRRWTGKLRQVLPTPTVLNNVVLYTALFDVANPSHELMTQMTAQVFFVLSAAYDTPMVPLAAVHFAERSRERTPSSAGDSEERRGSATAEQSGRARARGESGGRRNRGAPEAFTAEVRVRPATVTVVKDNGANETRNVLVGVTDRINAEIRSGLAPDEKVLVGYQAAGGERSDDENRDGDGRGGGRFGGGFGGGFGGAP